MCWTYLRTVGRNYKLGKERFSKIRSSLQSPKYKLLGVLIVIADGLILVLMTICSSKIPFLLVSTDEASAFMFGRLGIVRSSINVNNGALYSPHLW